MRSDMDSTRSCNLYYYYAWNIAKLKWIRLGSSNTIYMSLKNLKQNKRLLLQYYSPTESLHLTFVLREHHQPALFPTIRAVFIVIIN
jgi:hypothetical protein